MSKNVKAVWVPVAKPGVVWVRGSRTGRRVGCSLAGWKAIASGRVSLAVLRRVLRNLLRNGDGYTARLADKAKCVEVIRRGLMKRGVLVG